MKPATPTEALAAVLHLARFDHEPEPEPGCCAMWPFDLREAASLEPLFAEVGWLIAPSVSLPESAPKGREGSLDLTDFTEQVLALFLNGSLDTHTLNTIYAVRSAGLPGLYPKRSFDTPRKRLSDLERAGYVRQVRSGDKQVTAEHHGVRYGVWEITDAGRAAVGSATQAMAS